MTMTGQFLKHKESIMSGASREAFDLHNPACWYNFKSHLKYDKFKLWFWKLVISDTWNNVCPVRNRKNIK